MIRILGKAILESVGIRSPEKTSGAYLYCLLEEPVSQQISLQGIKEQPVYTINEKGLVAVISDSEIMQFDRFKKQELMEYVRAHQKVLEALIKEYDIVPFSFGVIVPSQEEILVLLRKLYLQFKVALQKVRGKTEFAIQIFWDEKKVMEDIQTEEPTIAGIGTKTELGKAILERVERKRETYIKDIKDALDNLYCDYKEGKVLDTGMIGNMALLIKKEAEPMLDQKMEELGRIYDGRLRFKYIGPMPPYSFTNINLSLGNSELIDQARKTLGLEEEATYAQIKKAYYTLAQHHHPDLKGSKPETEEAMKKIVKAYHSLEEYCRNHNDDKSGNIAPQRIFSFRSQDVERVFLWTR